MLMVECNLQKHGWQGYASMLFGQSNNVAETEGDSDRNPCQRRKGGCFSKIVWLFLWMTKLLMYSLNGG